MLLIGTLWKSLIWKIFLLFSIKLGSRHFYSYHSICSSNLFFAIWYFLLFKLKVFSNWLFVSLSFLPCNVSQSKQAAVMFSFPVTFPDVSVYPLPRGQKVSWSISLCSFCMQSPCFLSKNSSVSFSHSKTASCFKWISEKRISGTTWKGVP